MIGAGIGPFLDTIRAEEDAMKYQIFEALASASPGLKAGEQSHSARLTGRATTYDHQCADGAAK